jgi:hypothetical protein
MQVHKYLSLCCEQKVNGLTRPYRIVVAIVHFFLLFLILCSKIQYLLYKLKFKKKRIMELLKYLLLTAIVVEVASFDNCKTLEKCEMCATSKCIWILSIELEGICVNGKDLFAQKAMLTFTSANSCNNFIKVQGKILVKRLSLLITFMSI